MKGSHRGRGKVLDCCLWGLLLPPSPFLGISTVTLAVHIFSPSASSFYLFQILSFPLPSPAAFSSLFPLSTPPHLFPRRADGLSSGKVEPLMEPRATVGYRGKTRE